MLYLYGRNTRYSDNTITCGKVHHALCGECKMKCDDCPMCRSHKVQNKKSGNKLGSSKIKMNKKVKGF